MSDVDISEVVFLVIVFLVGVGGFIWAVRQKDEVL